MIDNCLLYKSPCQISSVVFVSHSNINLLVWPKYCSWRPTDRAHPWPHPVFAQTTHEVCFKTFNIHNSLYPPNWAQDAYETKTTNVHLEEVVWGLICVPLHVAAIKPTPEHWSIHTGRFNCEAIVLQKTAYYNTAVLEKTLSVVSPGKLFYFVAWVVCVWLGLLPLQYMYNVSLIEFYKFTVCFIMLQWDVANWEGFFSVLRGATTYIVFSSLTWWALHPPQWLQLP